MIRPSVPPLLAVPLLLVPLHAEEKTVTVTESALSHRVHFDSPTPGDAVSATTAARHAIVVNNGDSKYTMDKADVKPDSDTDTGSWRCVDSSTAAMRWKILALRNTALAYTISGGLTEILRGGAGGGAPRAPKKKSFSVEVPAATELLWNNTVGSHANAADIKRQRVAVGERVRLYVKNSHLGNPVWTASHGWLSPEGSSTWKSTQENQPSVIWNAPSAPGNCTITATFPKPGAITGGTKTDPTTTKLTFQVIVPETVLIEKESESKESWSVPGEGRRMEAVMKLKRTPQPREVNWSNLLIAEEKTPVATKPHEVKGYFATPQIGGTLEDGFYKLRHLPNPDWGSCTKQGICAIPDTAGLLMCTPIDEGNSVYRWETGSYHWLIPAMCRGADPRGTPSRQENDGTRFATLKQTFAVNSAPSPGRVGTDSINVELICTKGLSPLPAGTKPAEVKNSIALKP